MPIVSLQAENFKRITSVFIKPDGAIVEVTGSNGAGKSSSLDAIKAALGGKKDIPWKPIRDGAEEAVITVEIAGVGETVLKVTRNFKRKGDNEFTTDLRIENGDGARFQSPQTLLNGLLGDFSFDPLAFTRMDAKDQVEVLKRFVPGIDFNEIEQANRKDYDERRDINRRVKQLRDQADGIMVPADVPAEKIDESALIAELERAGQHNADIEARKGRRADVARRIGQARSLAAQKREQAERLLAEAKTHDEEADNLQTKLDNAGDLPAPIDTADIRARIDEARRINSLVDMKLRREEIEKDLAEEQAASLALTKAMEEREAAKAKAVAEADLPIAGLGFGDGVVLFNGQPLDQASQAEQIRVSVAIAAALNPKLGIALIKDGSLLDKNSWALLAEFAEEKGLQVFIETVDSSRPSAVVIEDGTVRPAEQLEAAE